MRMNNKEKHNIRDRECPDEREDQNPPDENQFDEEQWRKQRERDRERAEDAIREYWQGEEERPRYTPWLVIRYAAGDLGLRPIPGGVPFWKSPDIWVESSDPTGKAVAGEQNFIYTRIFNLGMAKAAPVKIDYYWANPALGLGAANMNLIGTDWVEVKSQSAQEVQCSTPWVPVYVNNGHECLMVNCTNPILDPITNPFEPVVDRHVGQRNISVLQGQAGATLPFRIELNNILAVTTKTAVLACAQHIAVTEIVREELKPVELIDRLATFGSPIPNPQFMQAHLHRGTMEHRNAQRAAHLTESSQMTDQRFASDFHVVNSTPRISGAISETRTRLLSTTADRTTTNLLLARERRGCRPLRTTIPAFLRTMANLLLAREKPAFDYRALRPKFYKFQEIVMDALESRHLDVEFGIPHDAKPGEYIVFHLEQWAEGMVLGGYTLVVQVI